MQHLRNITKLTTIVIFSFIALWLSWELFFKFLWLIMLAMCSAISSVCDQHPLRALLFFIGLFPVGFFAYAAYLVHKDGKN